MTILSRKGLLWAGLALVLGAVNFSVWQKEKLVADGKTVLLRLAPVDPRSLMQGDYMRLDYELARRLGSSEDAMDSLLRFKLDATGVAGALLPDSATLLAADEARMLARKRGRWGWRVGSDAYFFQEGTGALYDRARYGEYRVADNGESVLVALRDEKLQRIGIYRLGYHWQVPLKAWR